MKLSLALDLGTTSISAVAVDEAGRIVAKANQPNRANVDGLPPGHAEQDPQRLLTATTQTLHQLAGRLPGEPHCLGITGQMHGVLLVDQQRRPLSNLITWQDRRANEKMPTAGNSYLEEFLSRCEEADLTRTGCRLAPGYLAVTLFVLSQRDQWPADAAQSTCLADWIAAELCDTPIVTDRTNAAGSGVFDLQRDTWSAGLIEAGGLATSLFVPVRESGAVIGHLTAEISAQTGLAAGLPVSGPIGDNQAAVLGSMPAGEPAIQINVGTGGQINWPVDRFLRVEGMDTRYLPPSRFMLVGAGLAGGDAYAWVNRTVAAWLQTFDCEASTDEIYRRMNELATAIPAGNDGLVCQPLFRGTRRQPHARGELTGVGFDNFTIGHVARAVLQGIADGMYSFYQLAGDARPVEFRRIIGSGNGLRKNRLLVEILAKTFQRDVWLPVHEEEAAYGTALLAGSMTGLWPDLQTAGARIQRTRAVD